MTTAARRRPPKAKTVTARLHEELVRGSKPHPVDRANGIIRGVKVVGKNSPNTHGVHGVEGTEYTTAALQAACKLYEGLKVNIDHPPKEKPGKERSSYDRVGKLVNVRVEEGELYADLELLKTHPMAERLMEAAEKMPDAFALSHNAWGKGEVRDKIYVITEIPEVRSVDVVADGGTCASLFEGREMPKTTLRKWISESKALDKKLQKRLLEMGPLCGKGDESGDLMDADMAPPEEETDGRSLLAQAVAALVQSEDAGDHEMAGKIMKLLKPEAPADEGGGEDEPDGDEKDKEGGKGDKEGEGGDSDDDGDMTDSGTKKTKESREMRRRLKELEAKDSVRELCEASDFRPSPTQLKALMGLPTVADRKALIQESKGKSGSSAPRAGGQSITRTTQESRAPSSATEQASLLLR